METNKLPNFRMTVICRFPGWRWSQWGCEQHRGWHVPVRCHLHLEDRPAPSTSQCPVAITRDQRTIFSLPRCKGGLSSKSVQKNPRTWKIQEISFKSSFPLYFAGSIYLQCRPNDSPHDGNLCFPKMGPRSWLVHGFVFYGADTRIYGLHVSNPERLLKTGKSPFFPWVHDFILWDLCTLIKDYQAVIFYYIFPVALLA